jgi:ketosteroid isomerase-like protein
MLPQNLEAVRAVYDRWSEGDFRAGEEIFDPQVLFVLNPGFPESGSYLGLEGLAEYTRGFLEPWTRITISAEELIEAGDSAVVAVRQSGVGSGSGAATDFAYLQVWTFRGDKVIRLENFRERADAFAAAGLEE